MVKVTCFGGAGLVTGSNYLVETSGGLRLMIDCGLFQGGTDIERLNQEKWGYSPKEISNLVLTHAHIDHSGRIPKLVKDGFRGKIICSPPTAELCELMLLDAAHVQEMDAEWRTKKKKRQGRKGVDPLYTTADAAASLKYFSPVELNCTIDLEPGVRARLRNAGHILGSSIVELWIQDGPNELKIVFSGDLGRRDQLIVRSPEEIFDADCLFVESTYGNRLHRSFEESKDELLEAIRFAVSHNEKVIIPAFALERTQEILYLLGEFSRSGKLPNIPIFLDSPLAIKATQVFRRNKAYYDAGARAIVENGFDPFDMPNLKLTSSTVESMAINQLSGSAIIIAANGMCTAGRIKHHLKHNLWRYGSSIIIVGFQSEGTTGRQIVDGAKSVTIFGEKVAVRAKVFTIGGFSAHADQADLLEWVGHFAGDPKPKVYVVHGEPFSSEVLATEIKRRLGMNASIPRRNDPLILGKASAVPFPTTDDVVEQTLAKVLALTDDLQDQLNVLRGGLTERHEQLPYDQLRKLRGLQEELEKLVPSHGVSAT
ncbi:MAG: metallo-beta-lactamase family protein [Thermodesulfobacteriota bacterium]|nr:metallo-beta-lactamase family protein [Thermodesulfobacteriota bacterium]